MANFSTTAVHALRWLTGANPISDIDAGFQALADDVDAKFTQRTPTIVTAATTSMSQAGGAEADVTGSVLNVTPVVVSTVLVFATIELSVNSSVEAIVRVRQDSTNDGMAFKSIPGSTGTVTIPAHAVFTGVSAAAHTYRLRFESLGTAAVARFRITAAVIPT